MNVVKEENRVYHFEYNRDVVYDRIVELTVEEMNTILKIFSEEDQLFFYYHNPNFQNKPGNRIHPNAKIEQSFRLLKFSIRIV